MRRRRRRRPLVCLVNSEKATGSRPLWRRGRGEVKERELEKGNRRESYAEVRPSRKPVKS